ncbi:alpha/beta fold hydrolase [Nocardia sp. NPDC005746]|uniref:alpha/beta fold hydrolase n=1 Tax=unclassified Nocardia TaxID=2637762 RepID=UPI0033EDC2CE
MAASAREGTGESVLLLHGFTLSHHVWRPVVTELAPDYDVLAPTLPGHWGGSPLPSRDAGVCGIAEGIERQLDAVGWDTCHIVGNSLGGHIAFELERRGRARSLAAINAGIGAKRFDANGIRVAAMFILQYRLVLATRMLGDGVATNPRFQKPVLVSSAHDLSAVDPVDAADMLRAIAHCSTYLPSIRAFARDGLVVDLDQVRVPTSILVSEFDIYPNHAPHIRRILDHLPGHIREVTLPGVGHIPMLEAPSQIANALREHFRFATANTSPTTTITTADRPPQRSQR